MGRLAQPIALMTIRLTLFAGAALLPGTALAGAGDQASSEETAAAKTLEKSAYEHYKAKRYRMAAQLYHAAFAMNGDPNGLFNAARAEQRGFVLDAAQADFERFLTLAPAGHDGIRRAKVHLQEITEAKAALAGKSGQAGAHGSVPAPVQAADEAEGLTEKGAAAADWRRPAAWGAVGLGALGVGLGAWWLVSGLQDSGDLDDRLDATRAGDTSLSYSEAQAENERINSTLVRGYVAAGVGVVAAGVGGWLLFQGQAGDQVAVVPGPRLAGLGLALRF